MADLTSISLYPVPSPKSRATLTSRRTELSAEPGGRAEHSHEKETQDRDAMSRDRAPGVANWPWPCTRPSISASRWSAAASIKERMGKVENPRVRQNHAQKKKEFGRIWSASPAIRVRSSRPPPPPAPAIAAGEVARGNLPAGASDHTRAQRTRPPQPAGPPANAAPTSHWRVGPRLPTWRNLAHGSH